MEIIDIKSNSNESMVIFYLYDGIHVKRANLKMHFEYNKLLLFNYKIKHALISNLIHL